jgi:hypothetical protein
MSRSINQLRNEVYMAITHSKQVWTPGSIVKVGFLSLRVLEIVPTPGDYRPDLYRLESLDSSKQYEFTPHFGLTRI